MHQMISCIKPTFSRWLAQLFMRGGNHRWSIMKMAWGGLHDPALTIPWSKEPRENCINGLEYMSWTADEVSSSPHTMKSGSGTLWGVTDKGFVLLILDSWEYIRVAQYRLSPIIATELDSVSISSTPLFIHTVVYPPPTHLSSPTANLRLQLFKSSHTSQTSKMGAVCFLLNCWLIHANGSLWK